VADAPSYNKAADPGGARASAHPNQDGTPSDVTNLMFLGTREQIISAFNEAGWFEAVPSDFGSNVKSSAGNFASNRVFRCAGLVADDRWPPTRPGISKVSRHFCQAASHTYLEAAFYLRW